MSNLVEILYIDYKKNKAYKIMHIIMNNYFKNFKTNNRIYHISNYKVNNLILYK